MCVFSFTENASFGFNQREIGHPNHSDKIHIKCCAHNIIPNKNLNRYLCIVFLEEYNILCIRYKGKYSLSSIDCHIPAHIPSSDLIFS